METTTENDKVLSVKKLFMLCVSKHLLLSDLGFAHVLCFE